jgi:arginine decarboxylase
MEVESLRAMAPLLDSYLSYLDDGNQPFSTPGHKQRASFLDRDLGRVVDQDVPLYGGLDEVKLSRGLLEHAESLAAQCWNADWLRFSTGGSTHANQAIIFSLGQPGDKVAISRTAHRSTLTALVLAGLDPIWLMPEINLATGVPIGIPLWEIERALLERPIALILTEPGYLGTLSDLPPVIKTAHKRGIPVIIDSAWGGHFGFHPMLPPHPLQLDADAFVTSIHKALPGYSASAIAAARIKFLDRARLEQGFESTHTTSPAGAPLASIDGVRALMQMRGVELIDKLLINVKVFRDRLICEFGNDILLKSEDFGIGRFDPVKLVLRANIIGADGIDIENELIVSNIRVEMADRDTLIFQVTIADDSITLGKLADVLIPILHRHSGTPRKSAAALSWKVTPQKGASLRDAYFGKSKLVTASEAVGMVSVDLVAPYPPGVAVLAPGEIITKEILDGLLEAKNEGTRIAYATDHTLTHFRVLVK